MAEKNYYQILGVSKNASEAQIKKAFRKLVRKYHPDVSDAPDADEKIAELNNAYDTLGDPEKRADYDRQQSSIFGNTRFSDVFNSGSQNANQGFNWEDIKDQFGEGSLFGSGSFRFDDVFSAFGYTGKTHKGSQPNEKQSSQPNRQRKSSSSTDGLGVGKNSTTRTSSSSQDNELNQHSEIAIDLESVYTGDNYNIKLNVPVRLANGDVGHEQKSIKFTVPKGITEGKQIRLAGQGSVSLAGGSNGDLFLKVKINTPENIRLDGADVYQTINVMPWEAALGAKITVDSYAGSFEISIPENAPAGSSLRLKGKGIPAKQAGDLYLVMNIVNPSVEAGFSKEQKLAYQQLKAVFQGIKIQR